MIHKNGFGFSSHFGIKYGVERPLQTRRPHERQDIASTPSNTDCIAL